MKLPQNVAEFTFWFLLLVLKLIRENCTLQENKDELLSKNQVVICKHSREQKHIWKPKTYIFVYM